MKSRLRSARHKGERIGIVPFRIFAYLLHATGLERFYKPRYIRHRALFEITEDLVERLPRYSVTMTGAKQDPINLIFVGDEKDIKLAFKQAGWHGAHPANPLLLLWAGLSSATRRKYFNAPFMPQFVNIGLQDMGFQKHAKIQNTSQRHHVRVWKSGIVLPGNQRLWIAAGCFDTKIKLQLRPPFINHDIDPDLDSERELIVHELVKISGIRLKSVKMIEPVFASSPAESASGGKYFTDGRAVVIEL